MMFADCHHNFLRQGSSHRRSLTVPVTAIFSILGEPELGGNLNYYYYRIGGALVERGQTGDILRS
jgi:hypothetical protein